MISEDLELYIVLIGWVVPILLGLFLLKIKTPETHVQVNYEKGKTATAVAFLLFGVELLCQWLMRKLEIGNPVLSVSIYLFFFCLATLMLAFGYCKVLRPNAFNMRQKRIGLLVLSLFAIILVVNYLLPFKKWQVWGLLLCCVTLFLITCIAIYSCVVVYLRAIKSLRTYYSDVVDGMIRWMPGVGVGILVFLLSAPFIIWLPRWVGVYQVVLGTILFIYTFICVINLSSTYKSLAVALEENDTAGDHDTAADADAGNGVDKDNTHRSSLSASLLEVIQGKEERWRSQGGYRTRGITIEQAAHEMGTNRHYLSRYLNEMKNMTFYEWVAQMRIREAQSIMINERNKTIEQIAGLVGFSSPSTFSITFKRIVGISPNQWRNQQ